MRESACADPRGVACLLAIVTLVLVLGTAGGGFAKEPIDPPPSMPEGESTEAGLPVATMDPAVEPVSVPESTPAEASTDTESDTGTDAAEASEPALDTAQAVAAGPSVSEWHERIDALESEIIRGRLSSDDADDLFDELEDVLWPYHRTVHGAVDRSAPDFVGRQASLDALYAERLRLFELVSPERKQALEGSGPVGRESARRELLRLRTSLMAQVRAIQSGLRQIVENVRRSPVLTLWRILQVLLALVLFRGWRRWSKQGLQKTRERLRADQPATRSSPTLGRFIWYLDRVNGPLSWLILIFVLSRLVMPRGFEEIAGLVFAVFIWILVARLAVLIIDAMAVHGVGGLRSERRSLRLRSLRLLAGWSVLLGLGLDLADRYVGHGSIYAWWVRAWQVLSVPIVLTLIYWWKDEIFERLLALSEQSDWARSLADTRKGIWSYPAAVLGGLYLVWAATRQRLIAALSTFESGRRALAVLVRRQVEQEVGTDGAKNESVLSTDIADGLLGARNVLVESVAREQLDGLSVSLKSAQGGGFVVIAERGGGKTTFAERLVESLGEDARIVGCPSGGYEAFESALSAVVQPGSTGSLGDGLADAIKAAGISAVVIDDAHLLARPYMGGQTALDRLARLDASLDGSVSWVLMMCRSSWRYILLGRGERALFQQVVELPRWKEDQLLDLLLARCQVVGIQPDFTGFVLPRQLDTGEHESIDERNRFGYARILWELADGNPEVAIRIFVGSLRRGSDDRIAVNLPQPRFSAALNDASVGTLLVLRVIVQCDVGSVEDISKSLRISPARALASVRYGLQNGWLEELEGGVRLQWKWYRTITRLLERRNLMPR